MGYIKFNVTRVTDAQGNAVWSRIKRMESSGDMLNTKTLQSNIIYNALKFKTSVKMWMKMDEGILDRDMFGVAEAMVFDVGVLDNDLFV